MAGENANNILPLTSIVVTATTTLVVGALSFIGSYFAIKSQVSLPQKQESKKIIIETLGDLKRLIRRYELITSIKIEGDYFDEETNSKVRPFLKSFWDTCDESSEFKHKFYYKSHLVEKYKNELQGLVDYNDELAVKSINYLLGNCTRNDIKHDYEVLKERINKFEEDIKGYLF